MFSSARMKHLSVMRLLLRGLLVPAAEGIRRGDTTSLRTALNVRLPALSKHGRFDLVATLVLLVVRLAAELTPGQRAALRASAATDGLDALLRDVLCALDLYAKWEG
ncbi:hypothetical protein DQ244_01630 [Blastococcus sp. TBT05-19]|uniref:hypothetical protein n=1 Tax=Blastococcus sp. TBT05-19 TaxID=2250581 RepID=UPI000DE93182|nr:hypothetical protein [Blastococcus sp. TBT05-19]RBY94088.1 hypothetical protein DQ244_01630 [Blastococcus sp. TBT05-19]